MIGVKKIYLNLHEPATVGFPDFFIISEKKNSGRFPDVIDGQNSMFCVIAEPSLAYFCNISWFYLGVWENIIIYGNIDIRGCS